MKTPVSVQINIQGQIRICSILKISVELDGQTLNCVLNSQGEYQIEEWKYPHSIQVQGLPQSQLTNSPHLDVQIWKRLPDRDLKSLSLVSHAFQKFSRNDLLWETKLVDQFGPLSLTLKTWESSPQKIYNQLNLFPSTVAGANLAVMTKSLAAVNWLQTLKIFPDIQHYFPSFQPRIYRVNEQFLEFFRKVFLGPMVAGFFHREISPTIHHRKRVPSIDHHSITSLSGSLSDLLYFVHPVIYGEPNPLYGLIEESLIINLFSLHAKRTGMKDMFYHSQYSASTEMRTYLGKFMWATIDRQINHEINSFEMSDPGFEDIFEKLTKTRDQLGKAIRNPDYQVQFEKDVDEKKFFNPNQFLNVGIIELIKTARVGTRLKNDELNSLRPEVARIYTHLPESNSYYNIERIIFMQIASVRFAKKFQASLDENFSVSHLLTF